MYRHLMLLTAAALAASACTDSMPPLSPTRPAALRVPKVRRTDLGTLGGAEAAATDINNFGVVVGWSTTASGESHVFRWTREAGMIDLRIPSRGPIHVNDNGKILVNDMLWTPPGSIQPLPIPAPFGGALDFNESDVVLGSTVVEPDTKSHAWIWSPTDGFYDIQPGAPWFAKDLYGLGINRSGVVMGVYDVGDYALFTWSATGGFVAIGFPPDGGIRVDPRGINDEGQIVGGENIYRAWSPDRQVIHVPFVWTPGIGFQLLSMPTPPTERNLDGEAIAVNSSGTAVGVVYEAGGGFEQRTAVVWPRTGGVFYLEDARRSEPAAINNRGTIVGSAGRRAVLWQLGE